MEQGPTITRSRLSGSVPLTTATASLRALRTVCFDFVVYANHMSRKLGTKAGRTDLGNFMLEEVRRR